MPFKSILKDLTVKSGASGAAMFDDDGNVVASYSGSATLDMDLIGAHHGAILIIVKNASERNDINDVSAVSISTRKARLTVSSLRQGYYLVIAADNNLPVGRAIFESKKAAKRIERAMG
jgi:predicted regulator of Ras-like GTPase activity (Roadblock/LC7/MglB family)